MWSEQPLAESVPRTTIILDQKKQQRKAGRLPKAKMQTHTCFTEGEHAESLVTQRPSYQRLQMRTMDPVMPLPLPLPLPCHQRVKTSPSACARIRQDRLGDNSAGQQGWGGIFQARERKKKEQWIRLATRVAREEGGGGSRAAAAGQERALWE